MQLILAIPLTGWERPAGPGSAVIGLARPLMSWTAIGVALLAHVTPYDPTPPYERLRRQLAALIEAGQLVEGEWLLPLRQLAGDLGLAVGTVARTYRALEVAGLLRFRGVRDEGDCRVSALAAAHAASGGSGPDLGGVGVGAGARGL